MPTATDCHNTTNTMEKRKRKRIIVAIHSELRYVGPNSSIGGALKLLPSLSIIKIKKKNHNNVQVINLPWSTPPFFSTNYEPQKPQLYPFQQSNKIVYLKWFAS